MSVPEPTPPALYGDRRRWGLVHADALEFLRLLPDCSVDAVITDPPYGLGVFNHQWDGGRLVVGDSFERWTTVWAYELVRVLRTGGYLAAFGSPRTMHRLVSGIENAGMEIRDQVLWVYGSGQPKGPKLPDDHSTTLKPAYEPVVLARAPLDGTTAATVGRWGTGALDIGATRVRDELQSNITTAGEVLARWPANLGLVHSLGCDQRACEGRCAIRQIDEQAGQEVSRFFYAAKPPRQEREAGLDGLPTTTARVSFEATRHPRANVHPTVKPLSVMRWLVRLVTPAYGVVLDPFAGSGSTGCAALLEDRQFLGIEREAAYIEIARRRLMHWERQ